MSIPVKSETFLKSIKSMLFLSRVGCFDFFALQMAEKDILYITLSNLKCQGYFGGISYMAWLANKRARLVKHRSPQCLHQGEYIHA